MPQVVEIPEVGNVEFPDEMSADDISTAAGELYDKAQRKIKSQQFYAGIRSQMDAARAEGAAAEKVLAEREANQQFYGPIASRISLGGISRLAGAAAKDILNPSVGGLPRATIAELQGEQTPPDIEAATRESTLKQIGVGAAELAPKVGAVALTAPVLGGGVLASSLAGGAIFGAAAAEESGGELAPTLKGAALGATFPVAGAAGRIGGGIATAALVKQYGARALQNPMVQRFIEAGAAQVPIQAIMMGDLMNSEEYKNATPEEQRQMLIVNFGVNTVFGIKDAYDALTGGTPLATEILREQGGMPPSMLARELAGQIGESEPATFGQPALPVKINTPIQPSQMKVEMQGGLLPAQPLTAQALQDAQNLIQTPQSGEAMRKLESRYGSGETGLIESSGASNVRPNPASVWFNQPPLGPIDVNAIRMRVRDQLRERGFSDEYLSGIGNEFARFLLENGFKPNVGLTESSQNAIQEQGANAGVLRGEGSTVGLPEVAQGEPQAPGTQTTVPQEPKTKGGLTLEEQAAAQAELDQALGQTRAYRMSLIPGGEEFTKALGESAEAYRRLVTRTKTLPDVIARFGLQRTKQLLEEWENGAELSDDNTHIVGPGDTRQGRYGTARLPTKDFLKWLSSDDAIDAIKFIESRSEIANPEEPLPPSAREMALIPGGRQLGQALGQAASAYRRLRRRGQAPAAQPGNVPGQQQPPGTTRAGVPPGTPPAGAPQTGGMPPLPAGGFAPGGAGRPLKGFAEVDRVFGAPDVKVPKPGEIASKIVEAMRTGLSSKHRGAGWLQAQIEKYYGLPKDPRRLDAYLESLKGASGQGAVDVLRFDEAVQPLISDISGKDFNRFLFAKRVVDRLRDDPSVKQVDDWTIDDAQNVLGRLMDKLGPDRWQRIQQAGKTFQDFADITIQSMLNTGRINRQTYDWIKAHNKFYAPFVVMERAMENDRIPKGAGKQVDTQAELTKPIIGIRDSEFHLADMMQAMRRQIVQARILAEKQRRMHALAELATSDTQGRFIRPLAPNEEPAKGKETVTVLEDGEPVQYEVDPNVATAFKTHNDEVGKMMRNVLRVSSPLFRAGATSANLVFQGVNLGLADQPRLALMSKLGPNSWRDIYRYPIDFIQAAMSAAYGNRLVEGAPPDKLYRDFLESGAAGATMQSQFTPDALTYREPTSLTAMLGKARNVLDNPARMANAIEETTKIMGIKRAMRMTGARSGTDLAKRFPQMVTEVRRFSGSPDFGRSGSVTDAYGLNLLFMFSNPRIQGAVSDIGRLAGRDGAGVAAKTWAKIATTVGPATLAAWLYIHRNKDYEKDYNLLSDQEKKNYFMIPKNQFIINSKGERVRDWWRIPKRETTKLIANTIEAGLEWWKNKDPKGLRKWGEGIIEDISPLNIGGGTLGERGQSIVSSMNPIVKTPAEVLFNINTYTHQPLISDPRMLAIEEKFPEQQFRQNTPEFFKKWAVWMPDWTPPFMRSPVKLQNMTQNLTASLITQYLPTEPVEGRTTALELNRFMKRFQTSGFIETPDFRDKIKSLQADQALESLQRERTAEDIIKRNKADLNAAVIEARRTRDKNLAVRVKEMVRMQRAGVTSNDKQLLNLAPRQRAQMIAEQVADMDKENSGKYLQTLRRGRIMSDETRRELNLIQRALQPIRTRPTNTSEGNSLQRNTEIQSAQPVP